MVRSLLSILLVLLLAVPGCDKKRKAKAGDHFTDPKMIALADALQRNDFEEAHRQLAAGADVNARGKDQITLLFWTMLNGDKPSFKWILDHGADPNATYDRRGNAGKGLAAIHTAAEAPDSEWLEILLAYKADPNLAYKFIITKPPLAETTYHHRLRNLEILIEAGADVRFIEPESGYSLPMSAAQDNFFSGALKLLQTGADCRVRTERGDDLATITVGQTTNNAEEERGRDILLQYLKDKGVDIEAARKEVERREEARRQRDIEIHGIPYTPDRDGRRPRGQAQASHHAPHGSAITAPPSPITLSRTPSAGRNRKEADRRRHPTWEVITAHPRTRPSARRTIHTHRGGALATTYIICALTTGGN